MSKCSGSSGELFFKKSSDFQQVKLKGVRYRTSLFNLVYCPILSEGPQVGIVVSRRFGNAVARNRAKRIVRELARRTRANLPNGQGLLVYPRPEILSASYDILWESWVRALTQKGLFTAGKNSPCANC